MDDGGIQDGSTGAQTSSTAGSSLGSGVTIGSDGEDESSGTTVGGTSIGLDSTGDDTTTDDDSGQESTGDTTGDTTGDVAVCGDGELDPNEICDDGNRVDGDGCEADCTITSGVSHVVAGPGVACAATHAGELYCWGADLFGRLGYGVAELTIGDDETPGDVGPINMGGEPVLDVAPGEFGTCVILSEGRVRCWGVNINGHLGRPEVAVGEIVGDSLAEVPGSLPDLELGGEAKQLVLGKGFVCALLESGDVRCWGRNIGWGSLGERGYLGLATAAPNHDLSLTPAELPTLQLGGDVLMLANASSGIHTCALLEGGDVRCWGGNTHGQLGVGFAPEESVGDDEHPDSVPALSFSAAVTQVVAGHNHTCVLLETGEIRCWGANANGELGYGDEDDRFDASTVGAVAVGGSAVYIAAGNAGNCAILESGDVRCWGSDNGGAQGNGAPNADIGDSELPDSVAVLPFGSEIRHVDLGNSMGCVTTVGSEAKCWGINNAGQLGIGDGVAEHIGDNETVAVLGPIVFN